MASTDIAEALKDSSRTMVASESMYCIQPGQHQQQLLQQSQLQQQPHRNQQQQQRPDQQRQLSAHEYNFSSSSPGSGYCRYILANGSNQSSSPGQNYNSEQRQQVQYYTNYTDRTLSADCYKLSPSAAAPAGKAAVSPVGEVNWAGQGGIQSLTQTIPLTTANNYQSSSRQTGHSGDWNFSPSGQFYPCMPSSDAAEFIDGQSPPTGTPADYGPYDGSHGTDRDYHMQSPTCASLLLQNTAGYAASRRSSSSAAAGVETLGRLYATHSVDELQQSCGGLVVGSAADRTAGLDGHQMGSGGSSGYGQTQSHHGVLSSHATALAPFDWMKKQTYPLVPISGKTRTKDKYRIVYTELQKVELEKEFLYNQYISIPRKAELAVSIGLSDRQVKIWFQNRRAKERKQKKRSDPSGSSSSAGGTRPAGTGKATVPYKEEASRYTGVTGSTSGVVSSLQDVKAAVKLESVDQLSLYHRSSSSVTNNYMQNC